MKSLSRDKIKEMIKYIVVVLLCCVITYCAVYFFVPIISWLLGIRIIYSVYGFIAVLLFGCIISVVISLIKKSSKIIPVMSFVAALTAWVTIPLRIENRYGFYNQYLGDYIVSSTDDRIVMNKWGREIFSGQKIDAVYLCKDENGVNKLLRVFQSDSTINLYTYIDGTLSDKASLLRTTDTLGIALYDYIKQNFGKIIAKRRWVYNIGSHRILTEEDIREIKSRKEALKEYDDLGAIELHNGDTWDPNEYNLLCKAVNGRTMYFVKPQNESNVYPVIHDWGEVGDGEVLNGRVRIKGKEYYLNTPEYDDNLSEDDSEPLQNSSPSSSSSSQYRPQLHVTTVPMQVWEPCLACNNSGQCHVCYGTGTTPMGYNCITCNSTGRCSTCAGNGGKNVVKYVQKEEYY